MIILDYSNSFCIKNYTAFPPVKTPAVAYLSENYPDTF